MNMSNSTIYGSVSDVKSLLSGNPRVTTDKTVNNPLLEEAVYNRSETTLRSLLNSNVNVNQLGKKGRTPLYLASNLGAKNLVQLLLEKNAQVNLSNRNGKTPLFVAAKKGHVEIMKLLLQYGADLNQADKSGRTPLYQASQMGESHLEVMQFLLQSKANPDQPDGYGKHPLYIASWIGHIKGVQLLLLYKADVNKSTRDGEMPLHIAARQGRAEIVQALIDNGAKLNEFDKSGQVPLSYAVSCNTDTEIVKILLNAGADATIKIEGRSLLEIAKDSENRKMIDLLIDHSKHPNKKYPIITKSDSTQKRLSLQISSHYQKPQDIQSTGNSYNPIPLSSKSTTRLPPPPPQKRITLIVPNPSLKAIQLEDEIKKIEFLVYSFEKMPSSNVSYVNNVRSYLIETVEYYKLNPLALETEYFDQTLKYLKELEVNLTKSIESDSLLSALNKLPPKQKETGDYYDMVNTLQSVRTEEMELNRNDTLSLQMQTQKSQIVLQQELQKQKYEYSDLEQQQQTLQNQIFNLQQRLTNTTGIEQQRIVQHIVELQRQVDSNQIQLEILWNEFEIRAQKKEALRRFQSHPNLLVFYRTVHIKLEEIFISFKAVAGGFVDPVGGNFSVAKSVFDTIGDAVSIAPLIGPLVEKVLKWSISTGLGKIDSKRQNNTAANASGLVTLSEVKRTAESIARQLTERYAEQLQMLMTPEEEESKANILEKGGQKIQEKLLKKKFAPGAKQLATFALLAMVNKLYDAHTFEEKDLEAELLSVLIPQKKLGSIERITKKVTDAWNSLSTKIGLEGVKTKNGQTWHPEAIFTKPGIRTANNEYYGGQEVDPSIFGWRLGTPEEAALLNLKQVSAPTNQMFQLESQKIVESVNKDMQRIEQTAKKHALQLEKIEKTGQIVEGSRAKILIEQEREERKKLENKVKEMEQQMALLMKSSRNYTQLSETQDILSLVQLVNQSVRVVFKPSYGTDYFHLSATRQSAESILSKSVEGSFLIRPDSQNEGIVLSYKSDSQVQHTLLAHANGQTGKKLFILPGNQVPQSLEQIFWAYTSKLISPLSAS